MSETNFHLKDDFFEEILNGIPESDDKKREYLKKDEKNSKTTLSPDSKTRIKRVAASFLSSEESKKAFIELIKNTKKREQNRFLREIKESIFLNKLDEDESIEDEIGEEIEQDENKSGGILSKARDLKKKYRQYKDYKKRGQKIIHIINKIKSTYIFLSNLTVDSALKSKEGIIRKMNKTTNDFLEGNVGKIFHTAILPSISETLSTVITDIKTKIDKALSKFNLIVYNSYSTVMKSLTIILLCAATMGGALAAGSGYGTAFEIASWTNVISSMALNLSDGGDISPRKIFDIIIKIIGNKIMSYANLAVKVWEFCEEIYDAREKIADAYKYVSMGIGAFMGHYGETNDEVNYRLQELGKKLDAKGDEIISKINNDEGLSFSEKFQLGGKIVHDVFEEGSLLVRQEFRGLESTINYQIDNITSTQDKFNLVYEIMSISHFKKVELSPWSKSAKLIRRFVRYLHNSFIDIYEPLNEIVNNQSYFYNTKGQIVDIGDYISSKINFFERGVRVRTQSGKVKDLKLKRKQRKTTIPKSKNESENEKHFEINIYTKQSVKKRFEINTEKKSSKLLGVTNEYKPVVKIKNPKGLVLNFISDFHVINGSKETLTLTGATSYDFETIGGPNTNFYKEIKKNNDSPKTILMKKLFDGMSLTNHNRHTYFDPDFRGNYDDAKYMEYFRPTQRYERDEEGKIIETESGTYRTEYDLEDGFGLLPSGRLVKMSDIKKETHEKLRMFGWSVREDGSNNTIFKTRYEYKFNEENVPFMFLMYSELLIENYISKRFKYITLNHKLCGDKLNVDLKSLKNLRYE